jgi:hypothetical protein
MKFAIGIIMVILCPLYFFYGFLEKVYIDLSFIGGEVVNKIKQGKEE